MGPKGSFAPESHQENHHQFLHIYLELIFMKWKPINASKCYAPTYVWNHSTLPECQQHFYNLVIIFYPSSLSLCIIFSVSSNIAFLLDCWVPDWLQIVAISVSHKLCSFTQFVPKRPLQENKFIRTQQHCKLLKLVSTQLHWLIYLRYLISYMILQYLCK